MNAPLPRLVPAPPSVDEIAFASGAATLRGRLFLPGGEPRAAVLLHGAVGVPMGFYRAFALWLSGQGYACLTYDYRDFGASATMPLRASGAVLADWGLHDQSAAQDEVERRLPGVPVWVIGHSLGGAMLAHQPGARRLARVVTVASGLVHLRDHPWPYRAAAAAFWYGPGPAATALAGHLPGRLFGMGPGLPAGVYWQWRRWCTTDGFHAADAGRGLPPADRRILTAPTKLVAVADDQMIPPPAVWRLMSLYEDAPKRQLTLRPGDHGLRRLGHMGVFRKESAALWPLLIA